MYKLCKTEQSAARQRELEIKLMELMNLHRYEQITVSDFCTYADIPRKAFYRYFSSKDGALYALLDHTMLEYEFFRHPMNPGNLSEMYREMENFFTFWKNRKQLLDALENSGLSGILMERAIANVTGTIGYGLPTEETRMKEHMVQFSVCGLMVMIVNWHHGGYQESVPEMARIALRLISQPLISI